MDGLIFGLVVGTLACVVALLLPVPNKSKQTVYLSRQADNDDYMLKDAMENAGTTDDSAKIRDALEATEGDYVTGHLTFDEKHNPVKSAVMVEMVRKDGKLTTAYKTTVNP